MPTKTRSRANRFVAALLAVTLLVSLCAIGAYADADEDAHALKEQIAAEFDALKHADLSGEQKIAAYQALCQKYPDRPDVAFAYAQELLYVQSDPDAKLAAYDHAIALAKNYPAPAYFVNFEYSAWSIIQLAYERKASIYEDTQQQENYISAMRDALDAEEHLAREAFASDNNLFNDWLRAVESLQKIQMEQAELDSIEQWYKAGSPLNFTALDGRVQVTASEDNHSIQVQLLPSDTKIESVTESIHCSALYCQPVSSVMRSLNGIHFYPVVDWNKFFMDTTYSMSYAEQAAASQSIITTTTTYYFADGSTQTSDGLNYGIGSIPNSCSMQSLSLPDAVTDFLKQNEPDRWNTADRTSHWVSYNINVSSTR